LVNDLATCGVVSTDKLRNVQESSRSSGDEMKRVMNVTLIKCRFLMKAMLLMELLDSLVCIAIVSMVNRTI
jgi:hypothetical protein